MQVCSKMVTDWSTEISRGPNPSRSVDEAESLISEQLAIVSRGIKSNNMIYKSLFDTWLQLDELFKSLQSRAQNINNACDQITDDSTNDHLAMSCRILYL